MLYSIDIIERDIKPIRISLRFNFLSFLSKIIDKWLNRNLEELDLKLEGLVSQFEKTTIVFWQEDYDKIEGFIAMFEEMGEVLSTSSYKTKLIVSSICFKLSKVKDLAVNGEGLSDTEYLNLYPSNKEYLENQIRSESTVEVKLD